MRDCWPWLADTWNEYIDPQKSITITFDSITNIVESNRLDDKLDYYGGGGTSISAAFLEFEKQLEDIPSSKNISVIFISDG